MIVALIALAGVVLSAILVRRTGRESTLNATLARLDSRLTATELDKWRRREETMRMLRWAAERSLDPDHGAVGMAALEALNDSKMLQKEDKAFVDAILDAVLSDALAEFLMRLFPSATVHLYGISNIVSAEWDAIWRATLNAKRQAACAAHTGDHRNKD